jgi:hypothetical protein
MAAAGAATVAAEAIDATLPDPRLMPAAQGFLDPFQTALAITLELLESEVFPFASRPGVQYL